MGSSNSNTKDYNYGECLVSNKICTKTLKSDRIEELLNRVRNQSVEVIDIQYMDAPLCGSKNSVNIIFHYYSETLEANIRSSASTKSEEFVLNALQNLIEQIDSEKIQIHPKEILLPNVFLSVSDRQKVNSITDKNDIYLAPELICEVQKIDKEKSQIYSIGLVALFIMTRKSPRELEILNEHQKKLSLDQNKVGSTILGITQYTKLLKQLVEDMLSPNPEERISKGEVLQRLEQIRELSKKKTLKLVLEKPEEQSLRKSEISYQYHSESKARKKLMDITNASNCCKAQSQCQSPASKSIALSFTNRTFNKQTCEKQKLGTQFSKPQKSKSQQTQKSKIRWK